MRSKSSRLVLLAVVAIAAAGLRYVSSRGGGGSAAPGPSPGPEPASSADADAISRAFADRRSDVWVQDSGTVSRVLADDEEGSRHQRFVVRLAGGHTVLIAHNIDLAPRVPLSEGDDVTFRGEYEWNDRGGVVHWTHHDPDGRRDGGWIRHRGRTFE